MAAATPTSATPVGGQRVRDPRLDFYRGIAMLIIFTSHAPNNFWGDWIPGRFGFSDATEIFVFCSGMASAIAFGTSYDRRGWVLGTARVLFRCWQVYWAHICLFFALLFMVIAIDTGGFEKIYVNSLALQVFLNNTREALFGLLTLTYVPNYFDILPMYLVILAMMPVMYALARVHADVGLDPCTTCRSPSVLDRGRSNPDLTALRLLPHLQRVPCVSGLAQRMDDPDSEI